MPIEFHCPSCNRLLKTPDATAGKKGKCPHCQSVMHIPNASTAHNWPPDASQPAATPPAAASSPVAPAPAAPQQPAATGPIEFHCQSCQRYLKTPPQTAGKQGKCPHCGVVMNIPLESTARQQAQPSSSGLTPLGDSGGLTPMGDSSGLTPMGPAAGGANDPLDDLPALTPMGGQTGNPLGGGSSGSTLSSAPMSSNPYASPTPTAKPIGRSRAKSKVMGPAIGMIVYGCLALIGGIIGIVNQLINGPGLPAAQNQAEAAGQQIGYVVGFFLGGICVLAIFGFIIAGAIRMLNLKNYGLAMTACILSLLPCSLCCIIGLPFGIWGLVVLNDEHVKRAFR